MNEQGVEYYSRTRAKAIIQNYTEENSARKSYLEYTIYLALKAAYTQGFHDGKETGWQKDWEEGFSKD